MSQTPAPVLIRPTPFGGVLQVPEREVLLARVSGPATGAGGFDPAVLSDDDLADVHLTRRARVARRRLDAATALGTLLLLVLVGPVAVWAALVALAPLGYLAQYTRWAVVRDGWVVTLSGVPGTLRAVRVAGLRRAEWRGESTSPRLVLIDEAGGRMAVPGLAREDLRQLAPTLGAAQRKGKALPRDVAHDLGLPALPGAGISRRHLRHYGTIAISAVGSLVILLVMLIGSLSD